MKQTALVILFFFLTVTLHAQVNYSQEFGKVTQYEVAMTSYPEDPEAEALVIYENGRVHFNGDDVSGGFVMYTEKSTKIKILKEAGTAYAKFEIPYFMEGNEWEEVYDLKATTYNLVDGKLITSPLEKTNIFTEKINDNWSRKVFAMPDVRAGSIIEIKYTIISPYLFNFREWNFQKKIPVVQSNFKVSVIPYYTYTYIMKGSQKFDVATSEESINEIRWRNLAYRELHYTFGLKNIPAFRDEDFMTSPNDYMISLNFQLTKIYYPQGGSKEIMSTWPAICDGFLKADEFGKYINAAEKEGKKIIPTLGLTGKTKEEQVKIITEYVKMGYRWDGQYRKYTSGKVSEFQKEKSGSSADINLYLLGLLKAAQIEAEPILLSTRENGAINVTHAFEKFLNYVIVRVSSGDKNYFLDATERLLTYNELPERCTNVRGLVVTPKSDQWVDIIQDDLALTEKQFDIRCIENLTALNSSITFTSSAYDAYRYRKGYNGEESNLKEILQEREITPQGAITIQNSLELDKPFIFSFNAETPLENASDKLFIAPFLNQSVTENIFKQETRTLPIDLIHRHAAKYQSTIHIPPGYEVEYLPKTVNHNSKNMIIGYNTVIGDSTITVTAEYQFKERMYEARNYQILKSAFSGMIERFNEMIVLKKKENN